MYILNDIYSSGFEKLDIYSILDIFIYYIIQHRDRRRAPLSPPSIFNTAVSWDIKFSSESMVFNSLPPSGGDCN